MNEDQVNEDQNTCGSAENPFPHVCENGHRWAHDNRNDCEGEAETHCGNVQCVLDDRREFYYTRGVDQ